MTAQAQADDAMRERILSATSKVLSRHGYGKLNLSDVAVAAGISRPTLYKCFSSKDDLLLAFSVYELQVMREDLHRTVGKHAGRDRLQALLRFMAEYYGSYQMRGLIEIEPGLVLDQMSRAVPELVGLIAPLLKGQVADPEVVAMTLVRLTLCHYVLPSYDGNRLLDQLRTAVGVR